MRLFSVVDIAWGQWARPLKGEVLTIEDEESNCRLLLAGQPFGRFRSGDLDAVKASKSTLATIIEFDPMEEKCLVQLLVNPKNSQ